MVDDCSFYSVYPPPSSCTHKKVSTKVWASGTETPYLGQLLTESMHASLIVYTPEFDDTTFTWTDIIVKK